MNLFSILQWEWKNGRKVIVNHGPMKMGILYPYFSGSTGKSLPRKDVIEIEFDAEWERSFYLALRIFSDSDGSSYGNVGYHLSFSNNRINLQANKRIKGRIIRETLGSLIVQEMINQKKVHISLLAHRGKKEFIIFHQWETGGPLEGFN